MVSFAIICHYSGKKNQYASRRCKYILWTQLGWHQPGTERSTSCLIQWLSVKGILCRKCGILCRHQNVQLASMYMHACTTEFTVTNINVYIYRSTTSTQPLMIIFLCWFGPSTVTSVACVLAGMMNDSQLTAWQTSKVIFQNIKSFVLVDSRIEFVRTL